MATLSFDDFAATVIVEATQSSITIINETNNLQTVGGGTVNLGFYYDGGTGVISGTVGRATGFEIEILTENGMTLGAEAPTISGLTPAVPLEGRPSAFVANPSNPMALIYNGIYNGGSNGAYHSGSFNMTMPADPTEDTTYAGEIRLTG